MNDKIYLLFKEDGLNQTRKIKEEIPLGPSLVHA